jgi:hypothetical protein
MIRDFWVVCLLIGTATWAQTKLPTPAAKVNSPSADQHDGEMPSSPSPTVVPADAPVLTIKGLCPLPTPAAVTENSHSPCQTVITRSQFENLTEALRTGEEARTRRQLAKAYPQFLVMAHQAEQRGLDKQPRFERRLDFARLQILSQELMRQVQDEAAQVPENEIEDYYRKNIEEFELISVERIVIPNRAQVKAQSNRRSAEPVAADDDAMSKEADLLHGRAVAGEDFTALQKDAYDAAGVSGNNPAKPQLEKMRRGSLPPAHASVFDLKPGEVSLVINDATGHYIYKVDWKGIASLDDARHEITTVLRGQRLRDILRILQQPFTTEMNEAYFGADTSGAPD